jgi:hypothetical protein
MYKTSIGFALEISGKGETLGTRLNDDQRTSALKFWSDDPKSLIKVGSGYWKYDQRACGVRFLTGYNYETRFGGLGRVFDRLIFRPLIGWATAWSFDRLRLWIENGIDPSTSLYNSMTHALARLTLIFIWFYQGLVPKLLFSHHDELVMMAATGVPSDVTPLAVQLFGLVEILFAFFLLLSWKHRRVLLINILLMIFAALGVAVSSPSYLVAAFNPVTLNIAVIILALIGYLSSAYLPSASRCLRKE